MFHIYVLQLQSNKYYIGKTKNLKSRLDDHFVNCIGSEWTNKYRPLQIVEVFGECDAFDEDKITKKYMSKYGIENVRGGAYCQLVLDKHTVEFIQKEIDSATDKCYKCGSKGHFAKQCKGRLYCTRCGRNTHTIDTCYANTTLEGKSLAQNMGHDSSLSLNNEEDEEVVESSKVCECNMM